MIKVIFCAFNEELSLQKLLVNLIHEFKSLEENFEIIICLDGTTDGSLKLLQEFKKFHPIKILPLKNERGLGLAYKRIFLEIVTTANDDDLVISLDADNTHNVEQIPQMIQHVAKNNLDVLVASRFVDKSIMAGFPKYRQAISKAISITLQTLFPIRKIDGKKLQDYTSGYRAYKAKKLKELFALKKDNFITEPEFTYTCEFLIKLSRINSRIDEIAISYNYDNKIGASKLRIMKNFRRLILLIIKLKFNS